MQLFLRLGTFVVPHLCSVNLWFKWRSYWPTWLVDNQAYANIGPWSFLDCYSWSQSRARRGLTTPWLEEGRVARSCESAICTQGSNCQTTASSVTLIWLQWSSWWLSNSRARCWLKSNDRHRPYTYQVYLLTCTRCIDCSYVFTIT